MAKNIKNNYMQFSSDSNFQKTKRRVPVNDDFSNVINDKNKNKTKRNIKTYKMS